VDLTQKKAQDLQGRRKSIENELNRMFQQINEMDQKIRFYLSDRQKNPHPRHIEFIEKIQRYRIDPNVSNRHLESLLDNLQWKIYYYQRAWNQMWENAEAAFRQSRQPVLETTPPPSPEPANASQSSSKSKPQYSIETLWEVQLEKLKQNGVRPDESPLAFKQRMYHEYKELSMVRKDNQDVVMIYDAQNKKCKLDLKDK
jgi:hypothetical protein